MSLLILQTKYKFHSFLKNYQPLFHTGVGLIIVLFLLSLFSCGLPTYAYLYPPVLDYTRDDPESIPDQDLTFHNAYENNTSIFSGYEIYYKIYNPADSEEDDDLYIDDKLTITASATGDNTDLENKGFTRLYLAETADLDSFTHTETKPAFLLSADLLDQDFRIRLKFNQEEEAGSSFLAEAFESDLDFTDPDADPPINSAYRYLYRRVINSSTSVVSNKVFDIDDFNIYDGDMPDSIDTDSTSDYLYISFFILSYGRDIIESVYSTPLYLGTLKFDCNLSGF